MFISKKKHNQIIEHKDKTINDYFTKITKLEKELGEAKDLKTILNKFSSITINGMDWGISGGSWSAVPMTIPDTVLQYTDDILGGKVIKQEGVKCLVIDSKGDVKTGLTKQKADKGYSYKLVRN